jgi:hypothetical protein
VRILAVPGPRGGPADARNRAIEVLASAGITADDIIVPDAAKYTPVSVTVGYNFPVVLAGFIPGMDCTTIWLESTSTMRREY